MSEDDYEVGYGKPPVHTRFRKGEVNNPRGRPKGSKNTRTLFIEEMNAKVTINTSEGPKKITARHANIKRLIERALKGDIKASMKLFELDEKFNPQDFVPPDDPDAPKTGLLVLSGHAPETYEELHAQYGDMTYQTLEEYETERKVQEEVARQMIEKMNQGR